MTGILEPLSACLYAAGAVLLAAAAAIYKRNGLHDYYCLMHGKPVKSRGKEKPAGRPARRVTGKGASRIRDVRKREKPAPARQKRPEGGTQVLDGSSETTLLGKEGGAESRTMRPAQGGRIWGRPTGRFRVTKSEVVIHTDRTIHAGEGTKGEEDGS